MLEIKNLTVGYGAINALHGISLSVKAGAIVTLIGSNGAGKTTTLKTVSGLLKPRAGTIFYDGRDIAGLPPHEVVRRGLAHVPEGRMIFANLSVRENLEMGAYLVRDKQQERAELEFVFATFPRLQERERQMAGTMSGGEQQMLAMARSLSVEPAALLLDEISMGLAPLIVDELYALVATVAAEGVAILLTEQFARAALEVADHVVLMSQGRVVASGTPDSLPDDLAATYLGGAAELAAGPAARRDR